MTLRFEHYLWWFGLVLLTLAFLLSIKVGAWPSFYQESLAAAGLACWLLAVRPARIHGVSLFLLVLGLTAIIQYALGVLIFANDMALPLLYLLMLALAYEIGAQLGTDQGDHSSFADPSSGGAIRALWWALLMAALISAGIAARQWLGMATSDFEIHMSGARPYANLGQPNLLGTLLLLGACGLLFLHQTRQLAAWVALLLVGFLLAALALTLSRTAWLFAAIALIYMYWQMHRKQLRLPLWLPAVLVLFFAACVLAVNPLADWLNGTGVNMGHRATASARLTLWTGAVQAIVHGPWYGYGWLQAGAAQLASGAYGYHGRMSYAHNLALDVLIWLGPWLGLLVLAVAAVWLLRCFFRCRGAGEATAWLAVIALLNHSLLEYPFAYLYFLLPVGVLLGWLTGRHQRPCIRLRPWAGNSLAVGTVALMVAFALVVMPEYRVLTQSGFNIILKRAHVQGYPEADLLSVALLQSLKGQQTVLQLPADRALPAADAELLKEVTRRRPTLSNLVRQGYNFAYREQPQSYCLVMSEIAQLYGPEALQEAITTIDFESCSGAGNRKRGQTKGGKEVRHEWHLLSAQDADTE